MSDAGLSWIHEQLGLVAGVDDEAVDPLRVPEPGAAKQQLGGTYRGSRRPSLHNVPLQTGYGLGWT